MTALLAFASCGGNTEAGGDGQESESTEATMDHEGHDHEGHDHDGHSHDAEMQGGQTIDGQPAQQHGDGPEYTSAYVCPMHCEGSGSAEPGKCPACGMDYVKNEDHVHDGHDHMN